ncbi:GAF and ANTAR domain-containing protein [uncultured Jatrophihabitans sp.]|uniref:GAF and ANTAR domain-containing protein n=1 Tax=uncultured Jatrophihabitans sp. TaxID=1610747 RepID=UPI0035CB1302
MTEPEPFVDGAGDAGAQDDAGARDGAGVPNDAGVLDTPAVTSFDSQAGRDLLSGEGLTAAQSDADEQDVFFAVQGLTTLVSQVDDLEVVLTQIAELAASAAPGADGAGVTLMQAGSATPKVVAWAVTDPIVREIDRLQYDICHEGPCLTAMQSRRSQVSGSLGSDERWRRFGGRVARLQVHSALALPLIVLGDVVGALNIYARTRDAFTAHSVRLAERFAQSAAVSVGNIQLLHAAHTRATQLQTALSSRALIDQAIGIVRSRTGGSEREAFDRLRQTSQAENVKLSVVAERIVDEAVRRAHARHSRPDGGG